MLINNFLKKFSIIVVIICGLDIGSVAAQNLPDVVVKPYNGRPTVFVDGQPTALSCYNTFGERAFKEDMPLFYRHNMHVYFISTPVSAFWSGDSIFDKPHNEEGISIDEQAESIIKGKPDAYIFVRFSIDDPHSWGRLHPNEYFITDDGNVSDTPSLASDLFWKKAAEASTAIVKYCESRPWASRVIGYANFHKSEGSHMPVAEGFLYDHNPLMLQRWREFLREKFGSVQNLGAAYGDPKLTFLNAAIPKDKLRGTVPDVSALLYWQNKKDNQPLRDYLELTRDIWHARFREINNAMRAGHTRNVLVLYDCLKQVMLGWEHWGFFHYSIGRNISWRLAYPEFMAGSGHMNVFPLYNEPGFDGLITPHDYYARGIGGVFEPEGIVDSAVLHGKFFYCEMDTRTYLGKDSIGIARDDREFATNTWRNLAAGFTRGFTSYWMEFGGGWFDSDNIQKVIARQVDVINESVNWKHETVPGIAMILDDAAVLETNGEGNFMNEAVKWEWKMGLARCGVPHRKYLFEDLALDNFPEHRVFYFPNLFKVDDEKLALLKKKVFRNGNVVVWGPGSGISDGETIGTASAEKLTGFKFDIFATNSPRRILMSNDGHPLTQGLDEFTVIGSPLPYGPVILPRDGTQLGIAWTKGDYTQMGMAVKEFGNGARGNGSAGTRGEGDYAAIFTSAVPLHPNLWRNIARYAGAHIYTESNDVILADNSVVALHSIYSGKKRILLPLQSRVRDLISGTIYSEKTDKIDFDLKAPETRVFLIE